MESLLQVLLVEEEGMLVQVVVEETLEMLWVLLLLLLKVEGVPLEATH